MLCSSPSSEAALPYVAAAGTPVLCDHHTAVVTASLPDEITCSLVISACGVAAGIPALWDYLLLVSSASSECGILERALLFSEEL